MKKIICTLFLLCTTSTRAETYTIIVIPYCDVEDRPSINVRNRAEFFLTRYKSFWEAFVITASNQAKRLYTFVKYNLEKQRFDVTQEGIESLKLVMKAISFGIAKKLGYRVFSQTTLFEKKSPEESNAFFYEKLLHALYNEELPFHIDAVTDRLFLFVHLGTTKESCIQEYLKKQLDILKSEQLYWLTVPYNQVRYPKTYHPDIKTIRYGLSHDLEERFNAAEQYKNLAKKKAMAYKNATPPSPQSPLLQLSRLSLLGQHDTP